MPIVSTTTCAAYMYVHKLGYDKSHAHLVGRFDVFQKGEEGGNVDLSLKVLQGRGAPILKLISLLPIRRLLALLVLLFGLLLGIVAVIVVVVHVGIVAAAFAGAVVDLMMLLWLLWVRGSYHRFPKSFRSHDVHSTEKSEGKISLKTLKNTKIKKLYGMPRHTNTDQSNIIHSIAIMFRVPYSTGTYPL